MFFIVSVAFTSVWYDGHSYLYLSKGYSTITFLTLILINSITVKRRRNTLKLEVIEIILVILVYVSIFR